jgi:hypothetical protein
MIGPGELHGVKANEQRKRRHAPIRLRCTKMMTMTKIRRLQRSTWREHLSLSRSVVIYHLRFASAVTTIGSIFRQFVTSVGPTLALRTCANSQQTQYRMTFHQLLNHLLNLQAGRVRAQARPPPANSLPFPSRHRSRFRVRGGPPGHNGSLRLRPSYPGWHWHWYHHQHPLISRFQVRDRRHPRHYHRYHRVCTRASASTAVLRNVRLMSHLDRPRCPRRVRALQSARGAGQRADSCLCHEM